MFGISDMKKEVGFMQLQEAFLTVSNFSLVFWTIWTQMCLFYYKGDYTEEGAWPTASEKEGRCVVVEKDPCLSACSSVVPLGLSGQNFGHQCPSCTDEKNTLNTAGGNMGSVSPDGNI